MELWENRRGGTEGMKPSPVPTQPWSEFTKSALYCRMEIFIAPLLGNVRLLKAWTYTSWWYGHSDSVKLRVDQKAFCGVCSTKIEFKKWDVQFLGKRCCCLPLLIAICNERPLWRSEQTLDAECGLKFRDVNTIVTCSLFSGLKWEICLPFPDIFVSFPGHYQLEDFSFVHIILTISLHDNETLWLYNCWCLHSANYNINHTVLVLGRTLSNPVALCSPQNWCVEGENHSEVNGYYFPLYRPQTALVVSHLSTDNGWPCLNPGSS